MKTKTDILSRLQELVAEVEAEELAKDSFSTGDLVTFTNGDSQSVGLIESFEQDTYTVRVHAMSDEGELEATDEVMTLEYEAMTKYRKPEEKSEIPIGVFVSYHSEEGKTIGLVESIANNEVMVEVYAKTDEGYEPTGVQVNIYDTACGIVEEDIQVKNNPNKILAKFTELKMDVADNVGVIEGYASTFGNVDLGGDRVMKGAFTQTFTHKSTRKVFFDHWYGTKDIAGVGTFSIDENGLKMRAELPLEASDIKDAFVKIKFLLDRNEDMGLSIGYNTIKSRMSPEGIRDLLELAVMETSITPFPMNTEALIMSAKSRKIQYQAKRQAWQTIVQKNTIDAPEGNQLTQDDIMSLVEDIKTIINKPISQ